MCISRSNSKNGVKDMAKVNPITKAMIKQAKQAAVNDATNQVFKLLLSLPVYVLHNDWGFGKTRCERFAEQLLEAYDAYEKGYITLEDLAQVLYEETGMRVTNKGG